MNTKKTYNSLLNEYHDLQLRVTRFSFIEQQLKNAQDRIDHELVLYKRLNQFSNKAFKAVTINSFLKMATEAVVDILEVESSLILIYEYDNALSTIYTEGINTNDTDALNELVHDFHDLSNLTGRSKTLIVPPSKLAMFTRLSKYNQVIFHHSFDHQSNISVYFVGMVSNEKGPFYEKLNEKHQTIFGLFTQQCLTNLTNIYQNQKINEQFDKIKQSENELQKLSLIATRSKNGVVITNEKGNIVWVNESFVKLTGYDSQEIKGKNAVNILFKQAEETNQKKLMLRSLTKKENFEINTPIYTKQGNLFYSQVEIIPQVNDLEKNVHFIFVIKDITNEVVFKDEILKINSRFQLIADKSQIGVWEWNRAENKSTWNETLLRQYGGDKEQILDNYFHFWQERMDPEDRNKVMDNRKRILQGEIDSFELEYRIVRANDKAVRYLNTLTIGEKDSNGNVIRLVGSSIDITDKKMADEKVNNLKLFYENILDHLPNKVAVLNNKLELLYCNEAKLACKPFLKGLLNKSLYKAKLANVENQKTLNTLIANIEQSIASKEAILFNETLTVDGAPIELQTTVLPYSEENHVDYIIVSGVDITMLTKAQRDLLDKNNELQKLNSELDNFVYRVSHDLRSPLLSIRGLVSLVNQDGLDAETKEYVNLIDTSVTRMDDSIQDILEYSRNSRLEIELEPFNVYEMVHQIFDDSRFITTQPIALEYNHEGDDTVVMDKFRMSVLFKNLIGNAIKYRRNIDESYVKVTVTHAADELVILVADNGKGILPESINKVFDMFYRGCSDSVGTGLGLYICKEICDKLNGKIKIDSELALGTLVTVTIPLNTIE